LDANFEDYLLSIFYIKECKYFFLIQVYLIPLLSAFETINIKSLKYSENS
jgi:hypothetical protein